MNALVVDTHDAPHCSTELSLCTSMPERVLRGLGRVALDYPAASLSVEGPGADALCEEAARLGANLVAAPREALRLRPSTLVEKEGERVLSVAGSVDKPGVRFVRGDAKVRDIVESKMLAWVALWGGELVDRDDTIDDLVAMTPNAARFLHVLPARHALVRKARTPLSAFIRQARSVCSSCGACASACSSGVALPSILRAITGTRRTRVPARELATAGNCTGCAACDTICPSALSPMRLVAAFSRKSVFPEGSGSQPSRSSSVTRCGANEPSC